MGRLITYRNTNNRVRLRRHILWQALLLAGLMPGFFSNAGRTQTVSVAGKGNGDTSQQPLQVRAIPGDYRHFELDRLGNLFLISAQAGQITEYNKTGDSINHYDNIRSYGQISELDVSNPLKLAVYYRDFATIVVLDRFLSQVNTIDLRKAGIWEAQAIATSYDNQYWVYDKQEAKIKKVDGQGRVTFASSDLRQVFDDGVNPVRLLDRDGLLYAYDPQYGWYIFDYYGALKEKIPCKGLRDLNVTDGVLSGRNDRQLWLMQPGNLAAAPVLWPLPLPLPAGQATGNLEPQIRQTLFTRPSGLFWVLTGAGIQVYKDPH